MDIESIHSNELSFCSLWSRAHKKIGCLELFSNYKLGDDYFFNRLNITQWSDDVVDILDIIKSNYSHGLDKYYIHLVSNEENASDLPEFGSMKILVYDVKNNAINSNRNIEIDIVDRNDLNRWIDVFCKSFDIQNMKDEVSKIISKHYKKFTLLIAHYNLDKGRYPAGCCLLFDKNDNIGLYCLGTLKQFRRKGVARNLIRSAIRIARNNGYNIMIVQTLTKEGYEEFYKKLGFKTIYETMLYTLKLN